MLQVGSMYLLTHITLVWLLKLTEPIIWIFSFNPVNTTFKIALTTYIMELLPIIIDSRHYTVGNMYDIRYHHNVRFKFQKLYSIFTL